MCAESNRGRNLPRDRQNHDVQRDQRHPWANHASASKFLDHGSLTAGLFAKPRVCRLRLQATSAYWRAGGRSPRPVPMSFSVFLHGATVYSGIRAQVQAVCFLHRVASRPSARLAGVAAKRAEGERAGSQLKIWCSKSSDEPTTGVTMSVSICSCPSDHSIASAPYVPAEVTLGNQLSRPSEISFTADLFLDLRIFNQFCATTRLLPAASSLKVGAVRGSKASEQPSRAMSTS